MNMNHDRTVGKKTYFWARIVRVMPENSRDQPQMTNRRLGYDYCPSVSLRPYSCASRDRRRERHYPIRECSCEDCVARRIRRQTEAKAVFYLQVHNLPPHSEYQGW
jgi:hypothetical protein